MRLVDILGITDVYAEIKDTKMPIALAYKLSKLVTKVDSEVQFYRSKLKEIIDEYAQTNENGEPILDEKNGIKLKPGSEQECAQRITELENLEVEIDQMFTLDELEPLSLTIAQVTTLLPLIKE